MKKVLIFSIAILSLFIITGCKIKGSATGKESFVDLKYDLPTYTEKENYDIDGNKVLNYWTNKDHTEGIQLFYYKGKDKSYMEDSSETYEEKEFNGTTWQVIRETLGSITYDSYFVEYNNDLYAIEIDGVDKNTELSKFMEGVTFE